MRRRLIRPWEFKSPDPDPAKKGSAQQTDGNNQSITSADCGFLLQAVENSNPKNHAFKKYFKIGTEHCLQKDN